MLIQNIIWIIVIIIMFGAILFSVGYLFIQAFLHIKDAIKKPEEFKKNFKKGLQSYLPVLGMIVIFYLINNGLIWQALAIAGTIIAIIIGTIFFWNFITSPAVLLFIGVAFVVALFIKLVIFFLNIF